MFFYEKMHFGNNMYLVASKAHHINYSAHLHRCFEFFYVSSGKVMMKIGDEQQVLCAGQCAIVLPNQIHAYTDVQSGLSYIVIFSPDLVPAFEVITAGRAVRTPFIAIHAQKIESLCQTLASIEQGRLLEKKAYLYLLCAMIEEVVEFCPQKKQSDAIILKLLEYIQENFEENITLKGIAAELGYHPIYLSKLFQAHIHIPFRQYLNGLRVRYGAQMLLTTNNPISEIAGLCGFENIRSFNRAFLGEYTCTPTCYRSTGKP